jgi:hypothetical protein
MRLAELKKYDLHMHEGPEQSEVWMQVQSDTA